MRKSNKHVGAYDADSRYKDNFFRGIYNNHGYLVGSMKAYGGYGKHRKD